MSSRAEMIEAFLRLHGWAGADRAALASDASFRSYTRLVGDGGRALLMDAPPETEDLHSYLDIAGHLGGLGYSAPDILAADPDAGLALIEDLGIATFTHILAVAEEDGREEPLYRLAVDLLIDLHRQGDLAIPAKLDPYDDARLIAEAELLTDWFLPAVAGAPALAAVREDYVAAWRAVLPAVRAVPESLVLRDYHVDNLILLDDRHGVAACGLLDFQDAVRGPVAYDLVSLLEDARRDVAPATVAAMRARYLAAFPGLDSGAFAAAYAVLGAQRNAKIIGIFTRLSRRDGKNTYLDNLPRVWRRLEAGLADPVLEPVRAWFDREVPPALRIAPPYRPAA